MKHHEFSPSKLEQYHLCPGSYRMQKGLPETTSEAAAEGTLLHEAVAKRSIEGLTAEQAGLVEDCLVALKAFGENGELFQERAVSVRDTRGKIVTQGIADAICVNRAENRLAVLDWKFGRVPVNEPAKNIQIAAYALGAMQEFGFDSCECHIVQPRLGRLCGYTFRNKNVILANIETIVERATRDGELTLRSSEEACRYCKARMTCPAFRMEFQALESADASDLADTAKLEALFESSRRVKAFIAEIEAAAKAVAEREGRLGKYVWQTMPGAREIRDLSALYEALKGILTPQEFNACCKGSVSKLENALSKKLIAEAAADGAALTQTEAKKRCAELFGSLVERGTPTKKLVAESEARK